MVAGRPMAAKPIGVGPSVRPNIAHIVQLRKNYSGKGGQYRAHSADASGRLPAQLRRRAVCAILPANARDTAIGRIQNASAGNAMVLAAPALMRARCVVEAGSMRSMKKRPVASFAAMRSPAPLLPAGLDFAASAIRHHI